MIEIKGRYTSAKIFTDVLEEEAIGQVKTFCNQKFAENLPVRIMPDVHVGKGCVIGFTAKLSDKVIPSIVGVDIGCGMLTIKLGKGKINLKRLDEIIHAFVPSGKSAHQRKKIDFPKLLDLRCLKEIKNMKRIECSIGTLGGGNHFIEVNVDDEDNKYIVIHSGSRNLGNQIAQYYQGLAYNIYEKNIREIREELLEKKKIFHKEIITREKKKEAISQIEKEYEVKFDIFKNIPKNLCYLQGEDRENYLHDMKIAQEYASLNRVTIGNIILEKMFDESIDDYESFETIHNYIDMEENIIRKGAVSAKKDEIILIPINMRDGSLICKGKGNPDWNFSAPHGAGRLFARTSAVKKFTLEEYKKSMEGIYSTSISKKTLDECPMAYKDMSSIISNIGETAELLSIIKPIYNFKAGE